MNTKMHNEFEYDMEEHPLRKLLPVHWFLIINKEEVVDRLECLVSEIPDQCLRYDEMKC
jgi:hypothetical protein